MYKLKLTSRVFKNKILKFVLIGIFISGYSFGMRTECSSTARIAVVMDLKSNFCKESLLKRELSSNEDKYFVSKINYTTRNERGIEITFFDSCGNKEESARLIFKVVSSLSLNCLRAPYFLGFIDPEGIESLEAAVKITAPLQIPFITKIPTSLPHMHYLPSKKEFPLIQTMFKLMSDLRWKSFILEVNIKNPFEKTFVQRFIEESFIKRSCILPASEITSPIIYIGDIHSDYLNSVHNTTILIVGGDNIEQELAHINSTNLLLFLSDTRKMHFFSANIDLLNYLHSSLDVDIDISNFIFDAVNVYTKALGHLCISQNCHSAIDTEKWNDYVVRDLSIYNSKESSEYMLKVKDKNEGIKTVGQVLKNNNQVKLQWNTNSSTSYDSVYLQSLLQRLRKKLDEKKEANCIMYSDILDRKQPDVINQHERNEIVKSEVTDAEWWTTVCTVVGVGIAMFTVGFFAVYIIYTNIRGPQQKPSEKLDFQRDSSLRRIGSDKQMSIKNNRNSRSTSAVQRRDSRSSIRSNISDKSV